MCWVVLHVAGLQVALAKRKWSVRRLVPLRLLPTAASSIGILYDGGGAAVLARDT